MDTNTPSLTAAQSATSSCTTDSCNTDSNAKSNPNTDTKIAPTTGNNISSGIKISSNDNISPKLSANDSSATPLSSTPASSTPRSPTQESPGKRRGGPLGSFHCLWISDVHLGTPDCKAEALLSLLSSYHYDKLVLAGDIVDLWALKRRSYWPESHKKVLELLLALAEQGVEIVYVPGNHDEWFRRFEGGLFRGIRISAFHDHLSRQGLKVRVIHGDQFDADIAIGRFHARLGDNLYDLLLWLNRALHSARKRLGLPYWSLAGYIKSRVSKAQAAIGKYRDAALRYCAAEGCDMVVCGHIHQPALDESSQRIYANTGDWVENTTLIAETPQGNFQLLRWNHGAHRLELEQEILLATKARRRVA